MREIKFRAWRNNDMDYSDDWGSIGDFFEFNERCYRSKDIVYQQYTGLKDKNGKEIYESDIVRLYTKGTEHLFDEDTHVVEWISESEGGFSIGWGLFNNTFDYEVIGNIYEHPHLLKGESEIG